MLSKREAKIRLKNWVNRGIMMEKRIGWIILKDSILESKSEVGQRRIKGS